MKNNQPLKHLNNYDYSIPPNYVIAFLNFKLDWIDGNDGNGRQYFLHYITREESAGRKLPGSTEYLFLGIADFDKKEEELETYPEKWLYLLKHTKSLNGIPAVYRSDNTFKTYFEASARAGFNKDEEHKYTTAMMNDWDIENSKREACERAEAKGRAEGKAEVAKAMLGKDFTVNVIASVTGLTEEQVKNLQ